jgi:condensation enzyme
MTQSLHEPDAALNQFPLSFTQEFFCTFDQGDEGGAFGLRFILASALRITGRVDAAALQAALDDVVERHEILRTVVIRDVKPPYQQVYPPCQVPLEIRDLSTAGKSRKVRAEELIIETEKVPMSPRTIPLMRALLGRFDDHDSVLMLTVHHSAGDGWALQVIVRDLATFYQSRTNGSPPMLPESRQYREYVTWQRARHATAGADDPAYWREKLAGTQVFALPNDHPNPGAYTRPYSIYNYLIDSDVLTPASALAASTRSSLFMVLLAAFNVMAFRINGSTDATVRAFTSGHNEPEFHDTVGPFMNLVPFRTVFSDCATFREILERTRDTCVDAYEHEIPINQLEAELPNFNQPHEDPRRSQFILGMIQSQFDDSQIRIAEGSHEILERELPDPEAPDIPSGLLWQIIVRSSGELDNNIVFNLDEFDERTTNRWAVDFRHILMTAISEPDREWKTFLA